MNIRDIVDLAKAGYTFNQVKELIALSAEDQKPKDDDPKPKDDDPKPKDDDPKPKNDDPKPKDDDPKPKDEDPKPKDEPDYKTLYEEVRTELAKAQENNRREDHQQQKEDPLKGLVQKLF